MTKWVARVYIYIYIYIYMMLIFTVQLFDRLTETLLFTWCIIMDSNDMNF